MPKEGESMTLGRGRWMMVAAIIAVTAWVAIVAFECTTQDDAAPAATGGIDSAWGGMNDAKVVSTPRDKWRAGELPYLYQIDEEWAEAPYGEDNVRLSGCGPTCMSMVYVWATGKRDMDPAKMAQFAEREGYLDQGMTSWLFMSEGAQRLGLTSRELPADEAAIMNTLAAGSPIIVSVAPGDFTQFGHLMVISSANDDGTVNLHDPNSPENSRKSWSLQQILRQTRNLWAFSA